MGAFKADRGYAGYFIHKVSNFYLTVYRALDVDASRWISRDPASEKGGLNLYSFVLNSPIHLVDKLGLKCENCMSLQWKNTCLLDLNSGCKKIRNACFKAANWWTLAIGAIATVGIAATAGAALGVGVVGASVATVLLGAGAVEATLLVFYHGCDAEYVNCRSQASCICGIDQFSDDSLSDPSLYPFLPSIPKIPS